MSQRENGQRTSLGCPSSYKILSFLNFGKKSVVGYIISSSHFLKGKLKDSSPGETSFKSGRTVITSIDFLSSSRNSR